MNRSSSPYPIYLLQVFYCSVSLALSVMMASPALATMPHEAWGRETKVEFFQMPSPNRLVSRIPSVVLVQETKAPRYFLANLQGVNFGGGNFDNGNFTGANLQRAQFARATFRSANLFLANLQKANLSEANLKHVNLTGANLQRATLFKANLENANLLHSNLQEANLFRANLQGAYLGHTNMYHANLRGADLSTAVGLTQEQLNLACLDETTLLPQSFSLPDACFNY